MQVGIVIERSADVSKSSKLLVELDDSLERHFSTKNFGKGIQHFIVAVIYVHPRFDYVNRIRKPKYKKAKSELAYDVQLNYDRCEKASVFEFKRIVVEEIIKSLDVIERLKIKDFELDDFKKEWMIYLNERKYELIVEPPLREIGFKAGFPKRL